jgi:hypothetical protein
MRYLNRFLAYFRTTAKTVGLSPKALAPIIGGILAAGLKLIGVDDPEIVGAVSVVAASLAAVLLPPGDVVVPPAPAERGSDAALPPDVRAKLSS